MSDYKPKFPERFYIENNRIPEMIKEEQERLNQNQKQNPPIREKDIQRQKICANCGHLYLLHVSNFKGECDACDDPSIAPEKKCSGFKEIVIK